MAKLASLVVDLQLQSAELRKGLDEANRKLEAFAKQTERTANVLEGVFTLDVLTEGLSALAGFVKGGADAADQMGELAESIGVPVEALSRLSYAAAFSGSSTEAVGKALAKTAGLMAKALQPTSEQAAMFQALGVSVAEADGRLRATEDVFADIAQRFAETENGSAKTALAMRLFGDEGAKLVPLLNNGKAGLAAWAAEAERTGAVVTEKGAAAAGQFNDAIERLSKASDSLALRVAQDLAPSVAALAEEFATSAARANGSEGVFSVLADTMRLVASAAVGVATSFEIVGKAAAGAAAWTSSLFDDDATGSRSAEAAAAAGKSILDTLKAEGRQFRAIWSKDGPGAALEKDSQKAKPSADAYLSAMERTKQAAARAAEAQKKLAEASRKAAEESAKALDEYVKAALSLERQQAAIDRAADKRRADGASPTEGFADAEDALSRMAAAQKAALTMRARASEREQGGDVLGADRALRKADELEALAERASAAADAFRDMGKEAIDAAQAAMEAQVDAALALERTFDGIDREVAARRDAQGAALSGRDATAGFGSFNAALDAMADAMKAEAKLRSEAAMLEKDGEVAAARQALLAAEANRALADTASTAADALAEMDRAAAEVPSELGGMLTGGLGSTTTATIEGVKTGAAAGPVGAVVGGLVGLLSQSEQFQRALTALEEIFQALANSVGKLVEPLLPLLTVVSEVAAGLGALIGALSPIVEFVARPLFEVLKALGMVVLGLVKFVGEIINGFVEIFGGEGFDLGGIDAAMARLEKSSYESAKAQQKVTEKSREMAGALNVPSWWRENLTRNVSSDPGRNGGGTTVINSNDKTTIVVNGVTDPDKVADKVDSRLSSRKTRGGGNTYGDRDIP